MRSPAGIFVLLLFPFICFPQEKEIDSLMQLLNSGSWQNHAKIYNTISSIYFDNEAYNDAYITAEKALTLAQKLNDKDETFRALTNLAYIHFERGEFDTSVFLAAEALAIVRQTNDLVQKARIYNHLGNAYSRISKFDKSLHYYLEALKIVEDTLPNTSPDRNDFYKALLYNNIGTVYSNMGHHDEIALDYHKRSLRIRRAQENADGIASCLQNIGVLHERANQYDSTIALYNEALEIRKSLGQEGFVAELLMNLGEIYLKLGMYAQSEQYLREAIEIFGRLDKKKFLTFCYQSMAKLHVNTSQFDSAFPFILSSIALSEQYNYKEFERDGYQLLSDYFAAKGDYKQALDNLNKSMVLSDSVFSTEMSVKVAEIQTRYETEKMEQEIELLSKDNEIQSLKIKRKSTLVYILIALATVFILFLVILVLLLNRRRLKQQQIKSELEKSKLLENKLLEENAHQSKQLTTHALNMLQKNKLLQELEQELKSFSTKADDSLRKKLADFRRQINRNMNSEKDWELFRLYFEEVNDSFFTTLQQKSNELTTGDLKLAALIRLNLNIKEAAAVLNISPDSLRKARYRLRQKLGLVERENLTDYLNRIS